jgi:hypothetical protein
MGDVLVIALRDDGGALISGTTRELRDLAQWIALAAENGRSQPSFVSDRGLTSILIERDRDG